MNKNNKKMGGNIGYTTELNPIGGNPIYKGYNSSSMPIYNGTLLQNDNSMDILDRDLMYFNIINENNDINNKNPNIMKGGSKNITQLSFIKELSHSLVKLDIDKLALLSILLLDNNIKENDLTKYKTIFKKISKNNLLVLCSILLLNNYAIHNNIKKGGSINELLSPIGYDIKGKSIILKSLEDAFKKRSQVKNNRYIKLIKDIPIESFRAIGIEKQLNKINNKIYKIIHSKNEDNKKKYKQKLKIEMKNLNDILSPIGFTIFINKVEKI